MSLGTTITLTAIVSDSSTGNSNIDGANYTVNAQNWPGSAMDAVDGTFNSSTESVTVDVDASTWSDGIHKLFVYGWDAVPNYNSDSTAYATLIIDPSRPTSSVDPISPYWKNSNPILISATASDDITEIASVELYFRFSVDGSSWDSWVSYQVDNEGPWVWNFDFPSGDGYYEFKSIAVDLADNRESDTGTDAECAYDTGMPSSTVDAITPYWQAVSPLTITATASDGGSGVTFTELFYRFSSDNSTWSAWISLGLDSQTPWEWSFDFPDGEGYYEFYTKAFDVATNEETGALIEALCGYDVTSPTANAGSDQNVSQDTVTTFQGTGSSDNVITQNYTWTFTDSTQRTLYGPNPTYIFDTSGDYRVMLTVTDSAGNQATDIMWVHVSGTVSTGSISGVVKDENGNPISGATVTIPGTNFQATTNATGHYTIPDVPVGIHNIRINKNGYESETVSDVSVTAGEDTTVALVTLPKSTEKPGDFLTNYWWLLLVIILVVVILIIMLLARPKKKEPESFEDKQPLQPESAEPQAQEPPEAEHPPQPPTEPAPAQEPPEVEAPPPEPKETPRPPAKVHPPPPPPK
jgi:hypothetical protein